MKSGKGLIGSLAGAVDLPFSIPEAHGNRLWDASEVSTRVVFNSPCQDRLCS